MAKICDPTGNAWCAEFVSDERANLIGDDGQAIPCWEPRPDMFFASSTHTKEQAEAKAAEWASARPWTLRDKAHWQHTGELYAPTEPPANG